MKQNKNTIKQLKRILFVVLFALFTTVAFAQSNPPPPPGGGEGGPGGDGSSQLGGNAQIGGGVLILLTLAVAYGGKRLYDLSREKKEEIV
jgi:hypothetical protein